MVFSDGDEPLPFSWRACLSGRFEEMKAGSAQADSTTQSVDQADTRERFGGNRAPSRRLVAARRAFESISAEAWDALVDRTPQATPFSRHCVQRAWWDAYGATAHDQTLVVVDEAAPDEIVGIVPLMHRHELEPGDVAARTTIRHQPGSAAAARARFGDGRLLRGLLPRRLRHGPGRAGRPAGGVRRRRRSYSPPQEPSRWDVVDLRRLRDGDPAADALAAAFEWVAPGPRWFVTREQEDVCPVLTLPAGAGLRGATSGTLDKKERHEIRRKIRRAEAAGEVAARALGGSARRPRRLRRTAPEALGRRRPLPADTEGGAASRRFFAGLFEDCAPSGLVDLSFLSVRRPPDRGRSHVRRRDVGLLLQRGRRAGRQRAIPGVVMVAATSNEPSSRAGPASTSCAATSPTSTNGARSTSRSSACWSSARPRPEAR